MNLIPRIKYRVWEFIVFNFCIVASHIKLFIYKSNGARGFKGWKLGGFIKWEWRMEYKPSYRNKKLVSCGFLLEIWQPICNGFEQEGFP